MNILLVGSRADQELNEAPTPTAMLAEDLRERWNSYRSIIPTFVPASSTGSTREATPSVLKVMPLENHHCPCLDLGLGLSLNFNSSSSLGSESDPRRSPMSTIGTAADAVRLLTSPDTHYTNSDAIVAMENTSSALLIPKKNASCYGYSTVGHGFQYPPVEEERTPTGSFIRLNNSNSTTLNDLRVTYERTEENTPNMSVSTPLLDNISFSPFMNFTPESDIRSSESRPMFGERGGPGMKPYGMNAIPIVRHAAHEDIFSFTRNANPGTAPNTVVSLTLPNTIENNAGWLDDAFLCDLVAE